MAGHYFYDPRPFYGHNGSNGLMPMDELFYGRYESVPYWMDQRMAPMSAFEDYYPGHKQMATRRAAPEVQQYAYKRPEVRDDIYMDMYKRSPYNFSGSNGVAAPIGLGAHPEMRQQRGQTQDDTWVHAMTPHGSSLYGHGQPQGNMIRNGNEQFRQMDTPMGYMSNGNRQMEIPMNGHNKPNNMGSNGNHGNHGNKLTSVSSNFQSGNGYSGFENVKSSQGQGGHGALKSMNSKHSSGNTKQRYAQDDSSSEESDDEYENGNKNGVKWASKNSIKHGNGHQITHTQKTSSGHHKGDNYGYDSNSRGISSSHGSSMKSGGHGGKSGGGNHGSNHSKVSKLLRFKDGGDSSSSDSEDESYGHSNKGSKGSKSSKGSQGSQGSKGQHMQGSANMSNQHGNHGFQSYGQQQGKQMQYGSQSKGVELKVPICCDNCERKVRACLEYMDGVESVLCDQWNRKVIVYGNVKAENVLKRVRRVKKASELWQQAKQQQQLRF